MQQSIKVLKALADETRIKIMQQLLDGEKCACTILVGKAQSTVSGHLRILEEAGILSTRKVGINIWYGIKSKEAKKILTILNIHDVKQESK